MMANLSMGDELILVIRSRMQIVVGRCVLNLDKMIEGGLTFSDNQPPSDARFNSL